MLILADLSGIQDYLFDVRESGGGQARSLRFRSFQIQLITECVVQRLLLATGLTRDHVVFCAAGRSAINTSSLHDPNMEALQQEIVTIEQWLWKHTHGRLRISIVCESSDGIPVEDQYQHGVAKLQHEKMRAWSHTASIDGKWHPRRLVSLSPWDSDKEAQEDAERGRNLISTRWITLERSDDNAACDKDVLDLKVNYLESKPPADRQVLHCLNLENLARHIPQDSNGHPIDFQDLAMQHARGTPYLGVLKADADSLGHVVHRGLQASGLEWLRTFSRQLDDFFGIQLSAHLNRSSASWKSLYTIFSGGDDLLIVGPWNIVLDFAGFLQEEFNRTFGHASESIPGLTISAGVAMVKPKFPIHLAAHQAEQLLEQAKTKNAISTTVPKNQLATLGQIWKWQHHSLIIKAGKQLADWAEEGIIQRGWLHTILELANLRHGTATCRSNDSIPELATSHLVYHVTRNWPSARNNHPKKAAAREWINKVCSDFDNQKTIETRYLPSIVRYAILATRSSNKE